MSYYDSFGLWVKTLRTAQRLTQRELAQRIGCSISTIRKIEMDYRYPSGQLTELLAHHLEVPADELGLFFQTAHSTRHMSRVEAPLADKQPPPVRNQHGFRPLTPMVGRTTELTTAIELLHQPDVRLLTVVGPGGVGKTRLAYAVADHLQSMFAQGVQLLDLTAVSSVTELLLVLTTVLDLPNPEARSFEDRVLQGLQDRELLLVLDNVDHVFVAIPLIRQMLASSPRLILLLTSRAPLRIDGEHELRLAPLAVPDEADASTLTKLGTIPAVALLVSRTQALLPEFQVIATNVAAIASICRQVDGLPLALELAAAQLRVWSPQALAERLAQDLTMLTSTSRDTPLRQRSLRATVRWSYDLLTPPIQQLLASMSMFAGGATLDAITAICAPSEERNPKDVIAQQLNTLLEYSLVVVHDTAQGERRFTMLETIRAVAQEELYQSGQEPYLQRRHVAYFTQWSEDWSEVLEGAQQAVALQRMDQEMGNVRLALTWAQTHGEAVFLARLCVALWRYWYVRGLWEEGLTWHQHALHMAVSIIPSRRAALLTSVGGFSLMSGAYDRAVLYLDEAIEQYRTLAEPLGLVQALNRRGIVHWHQGQLVQAEQILDEGLTLCHLVDSPRDTAAILTNLGCVMGEQGQYDQAMVLHQESLQIRRRLSDIHGVAVDLLNLGKTALIQGDNTTAQTLLEEGLVCVRELGYDQKEAPFLLNLGLNACYQGRLVEAHNYLTKALILAQKFDYHLIKAHALSNLGLVALFDDDIATAIDYLHQSIQHFVSLDVWNNIPTCLELLAHAAMRQAHYQRAHWLLVSAAQLRMEEGSRRPPIEERLYQQAWEQLQEQGFTREQLRGYEAGQVRAWLAGGAQGSLEGLSVGALGSVAGAR